jgi:hypothetical protein
MIVKGVEFPEQLILDQRAGKLVIFAGAGVSLDRPSSLPKFVELTETIVFRKLKNHEKSKLDHVLGASELAGVNVHRAAKEILDRKDSRPTILHKSLLSLFPESMSVRVVTTNFDRHFSSAARELFTESPEEYYAPALPLGNDFKGIVYLHGSLERSEQRFVLTDSDFGLAYLTEGWATRFLWALFRQFTVLFVGYSHNDPVMHYLSKGLPTETIGKRYALTPESDVDRWNSLDIVPLPYPVQQKKHKAMTVAVTAWANLSAMGALDYEHRIKTIVEGSTHLSSEDSDFLLYAIKHAGYARFFAMYAERLNWLVWAEDNNLLKPLFQAYTIEENLYIELADWIAKKFLINHLDSVLALIQRQGQQFNPVFWSQITWMLNAANPKPDPTILTRILPTLLKSSHLGYHIKNLDYLLRHCSSPGHETAALLLFEHLTKPQINLQRRFTMEEDEKKAAPEVNIEIPGDDYCLREAWKNIFSPNMVSYAHELEVITAAHLQRADMLQKSYRGTDSFDSISYSRSAIEVHEQNRLRRNLDVIIDAARDSLHYLIKTKPGSSLCLIDKWHEKSPEIMKRISINAMAECTTISDEHKIQWLLDQKLLFDTSCVHEVFRALKMAYPHAQIDIRKKLLRTVKKGFRGKHSKKLTKETKTYEVYNLLYWIKSADPSCPLALQAFAEMQQTNPKFSPREHPDFHHWSGGAVWVGHQSPIMLEALLAKNPADQLDFLLSYKGSPFNGPDRDGLLNTITQAVQQNFDWGYILSQALITSETWDTDIWDHILRGWEEGLEDDTNLVTVLKLLIENGDLLRHAYYVANLLQKRLEEKKPASALAVSLAMQLAELIFNYLETAPEDPSEDSNDWLQKAINYPGGKLAEFWVHALSRERKTAGDSWKDLPEVPRRCLEKIIAGSSQEAQFARVFIASQLYFMFYMDASWTINHVIPLLDWSDPLRSRQAWDGYLFWGRYGENTLLYVMPLYRRTFRELHAFPDEQRRQFCEHIASIAIYSSINPLEDGWLAEFISIVEDRDRIEWAQQFGYILRGLDDDAARLLWDQWLAKYWHRRNLGQPAPLTPLELSEMVEWTASLGSIFDKVVKMVCELPAPEISDFYMFHLMNEKEFAKHHPKELGQLLVHLIPKITQSWMCTELIPLVKSLREAGLETKLLDKIRNSLVALGCIENF